MQLTTNFIYDIIHNMIKLYPHQIELINNIKKSLLNGHKSILAVAPCGSGKSCVSASIALSANKKNNRVLTLVHRKELIEQLRNTYIEQGVDHSICDFSLIQSAKKIQYNPSVILIDECHNASSISYINVFNRFPDAVKIGFTATPIRLGKKQLGDIFTDIVIGPSTKWLMENEFLVPKIKCFQNIGEDFSNVNVIRGEYDQRQLGIIMEHEKVYKQSVELYKTHIDNTKCIIYCVSVEAANRTAEWFNMSGYAAASVSCYTPSKERAFIFDKFRSGELQILSNAYLVGEGIDVPDCQSVLDIAKTNSYARYKQKAMRCGRAAPGKEIAYYIDAVGNITQHSMPYDDPVWTLEPSKNSRSSDALVKVCPKCESVCYAVCKICIECGYEWTIAEKRVADISNVVEVDERILYLKSKPYNAYMEATTFGELIELQEANGYKRLWAVYKAIDLGIQIPYKYNRMKEIALKNKKQAVMV